MELETCGMGASGFVVNVGVAKVGGFDRPHPGLLNGQGGNV